MSNPTNRPHRDGEPRPPHRPRGKPFTEQEIRAAFVTAINRRDNGDKSCPTDRELLKVTGGSLREVNQWARKVRGARYVRCDPQAQESSDEDPVVLGSDRPGTIGLSEAEADALSPAQDDSTEDQAAADALPPTVAGPLKLQEPAP